MACFCATASDEATRLMVQLAALIGGQALSDYRVMLGAALTAGVTPVEVKEIVYQAVPYAGMDRVFDFIHATNDRAAADPDASGVCGSLRPADGRGRGVARTRDGGGLTATATPWSRPPRPTAGTSPRGPILLCLSLVFLDQ